MISQLYKQAVTLDKQMEQVRTVMEAIRMTNVGRKKELDLLLPWERG